MTVARPFRAHWWAKSTAGLLLGFTLAIAVAGLFARLAPDAPGKFQMVMWLVTPVWMGTLSLVFLFRDGWRAWGVLGGANALGYAVLFLLPVGGR